VHKIIGTVTVGTTKRTLPWPNPDDPQINIRIIPNIA